jgi:hypothetical protein
MSNVSNTKIFPFDFKNEKFNKDKELHTFIITKTGLQLIIHGINFSAGYETFPETINLSLLNTLTGLGEIGMVYGFRNLLDVVNQPAYLNATYKGLFVSLDSVMLFASSVLFYNLNILTINDNPMFADDFSRTMTNIERVLGYGGSAGVITGIIATQIKEYGK